VTADDQKAVLHLYLKNARTALLWKLEGLSEYDVRRPMVPTATNLLGVVKHVASVEAGYLGDTFGRPFPERFPWFAADAEPNADMWATETESVDEIVALYHRVSAHSDATIEALPLDATGNVPWWPEERRQVTLQRVLVHMLAETERHTGHADIVRELIDGSAGLRPGNDNLAPGDEVWWRGYRDRVQRAADAVAARATGSGSEDSVGWQGAAVHPESRHLSVHIDRAMADVYAFASDPANLPRWAPGLGSSVVREEQQWFVETPEGRVRVTFAPENEYGVLDHDVVTPSGDTVHVPLRAIPDGDGCEVVFTLRRSPGMSDAEFERDEALVTGDLALLKQVLEGAAG
jgi:uncharacterized damage-inducible protein DinB